MKKILTFVLLVCFFTHCSIAYPFAPEEIVSLETVASQSVTNDEIASPYNVTGESIVNIVRGMVDFDIEGASIVYNRRTGQIFVRHTPSTHTAIEDMITKMRTVTFQQVEIEARLVLVETTDIYGLGIDLANINYLFNSSSRQFGSKIPLDGDDPGSFVDFGSFVNALDDDTSVGGQFSFFTLGENFDIDAIIDALEAKGEVNTLASPRLTVFNNQRAHLKLERLENFVAEIEANFDSVERTGSDAVFFKIETRVNQAQSGTILDVTPSVNSDGTIGLELHPMYVDADLESNIVVVTNVTGGDTFDNPIVLPIFSAQSIDTYLTIPNGGVAV